MRHVVIFVFVLALWVMNAGAAEREHPDLPGWPVHIGGGLTFRFNSFVVGDVGFSPGKEAITTSSGELHVWSASGVLQYELPLTNVINQVPTLGDLDGDGVDEILVSAGGVLHLIDEGVDGILLSGIYLLRPQVVADLDGDELPEIIFIECVLGRIHVIDVEGDPLPGWPVTPMSATPPGRVHTSPLAVADLDGDGSREIVVQLKDSGTLAAPWIFAFNADAGQRWSLQAPVDYETFHFNTSTDNLWFNDVVLGDVDTDGLLETVYFRDGYRTPSGDSYVAVIDHLGGIQAEWFIPLSEGVFTHVALTQLALGDLDGNGDLEIAIAGLVDLSGPLEGLTFAWRHDGESLPGFPVLSSGDDVPGALMAADLDGDLDQDLVSSLHTIRDNYFNRIYAWDESGNLMPDWPEPLVRQYPVSIVALPPMAQTCLADLDGSGSLDLIAPIGSGEAHAVDLGVSAGEGASHWPMFRHDPRRSGATGDAFDPTAVPSWQLSTDARRLSVWPSPASGPVQISFDNPAGGPVEISVYDLRGRQVDRLRRHGDAGKLSLIWNPFESIDTSGVYFLRTRAADGTLFTGRALILRGR